MEPRPCDWCDDGIPPGISYGIGLVRVECGVCGKRGPIFKETLGGGGEACAIAAWNRRAPDPLREALMWAWAAEHNAHDWNDCGEDNDATGPGDIPCRTCAEIADMRSTAADEVERLLSDLQPRENEDANPR